MRNIFLQKSYTKSGEKLDINPFKKNKKGAYLSINSLKFHTICFYCMSELKTTKRY